MKAIRISPPTIRELIVNKLGKKVIWGLEKFISRYSLVPNDPFFDPTQFAWTSILEDNWQEIRDELEVILQYSDRLPRFQDISPDQGVNISKDDLWKTFFLYGYGLKMEQNCSYCPNTTRIIEQIPGMKTAFFSIMMPGKHIPEHRGPYNGVLRCHLAVKVPEPADRCGIRVDRETKHWEEGKTIVFDDSYPHEAWNKTDDIRVVLFLDIVRPMSFPASVFNSFLIGLIRWSPFIRDAYKNQQQWDKKLAKVFERSPS